MTDVSAVADASVFLCFAGSACGELVEPWVRSELHSW